MSLIQKVVNHPAVSDPDAMRTFPTVRNSERDTLLDYVDIADGFRVLDFQSAGGYLSDEVHRRTHGTAQCFCIEPCAALRMRLNPQFTAIDNPVEHFFSVQDDSIDVALGLAGLHHSESHRDTISECHRVLKPAGKLAVCDVEEGGKIARWLNEYVDQHNPTGHNGRFVQPGSMSQIMREVGFEDIYEQRRDVPWVFPKRDSVAVFFKGLFGLSSTLQDIDAAAEDYFTIAKQGPGVSIDWQLIYATGRKPVNPGLMTAH